MHRTPQQQSELDNIEKKILILLFGSEFIPEKTAQLLSMLNINPNNFIAKLENLIIPFMQENGEISGKLLKNLSSFSKYNFSSCIDIPDSNFYLSNKITYLISMLIPGLNI